MSLGARNITQRITVETATPVVLDGDGYSMPFPLVITAVPSGGGTLLVERQTAQGGAWTAWPAGAVAAKTTQVLNGPSYALRFTAAVAAGIMEIAQ